MQRLFADTRIRFSCTKGNARSTFRKRGNRRPSVAGDMTPLLRFEEEGGERVSGSTFLSNAINGPPAGRASCTTWILSLA